MSNISRSIIVAGFVASAAVAGCADNVTTAVRPCPCADGNVCCGSGVCAADQSACGAATAALSQQASGDWVGYIENFTTQPFMSGSDDVKLSLHVQADGSLAGTVTLGGGSPPPVPTDPNVGWGFDQMIWGITPNLNLMEGYHYEVHAPNWEALRLRGRFSTMQPWGPWCALQTPILYTTSPESIYGCVPNAGASMTSDNACFVSTDPPQPVDCGKLALCMFPDYPCHCTASGCTGTISDDNSFDVALDADSGNGSISLPTRGGMYNVRLLHQ
jgi:hypothetical protein